MQRMKLILSSNLAFKVLLFSVEILFVYFVLYIYSRSYESLEDLLTVIYGSGLMLNSNIVLLDKIERWLSMSYYSYYILLGWLILRVGLLVSKCSITYSLLLLLITIFTAYGALAYCVIYLL